MALSLWSFPPVYWDSSRPIENLLVLVKVFAQKRKNDSNKWKSLQNWFKPSLLLDVSWEMGWSLYLTRDRSLFGLPEPIEWLLRAAGTVRKSDIDISKQVASKLCEKREIQTGLILVLKQKCK